MKFRRGQFRYYRAVIRVNLGPTQSAIDTDDEIEFDGYVLRMSGQDIECPQLKGAIQSGWLVPAEDEDAVYHPMSAGIKVRPSGVDSQGNPSVKADTEERVTPQIIVHTVQEAINSSDQQDASRSAKKSPKRPRDDDSEFDSPFDYRSDRSSSYEREDEDEEELEELQVKRPPRSHRVPKTSRSPRRPKAGRYNPAETGQHLPPLNERTDDVAIMVPDMLSTDVLYPNPHASSSVEGELEDDQVSIRHTPLPAPQGPQVSGAYSLPKTSTVGISFDENDDIVV